MNRVDDGKTAVKLANPKTAEYQVNKKIYYKLLYNIVIIIIILII